MIRKPLPSSVTSSSIIERHRDARRYWRRILRRRNAVASRVAGNSGWSISVRRACRCDASPRRALPYPIRQHLVECQRSRKTWPPATRRTEPARRRLREGPRGLHGQGCPLLGGHEVPRPGWGAPKWSPRLVNDGGAWRRGRQSDLGKRALRHKLQHFSCQTGASG